jgi:hypothetical protein
MKCEEIPRIPGVEGFQDVGQPVMYQGPQEFGKYLKDGFDDYGKLIKEFNIKLE